VLFTIRPDEPLLNKGPGGAINDISFVWWRPQGDNDLPPTIYHGKHLTLALLPDDSNSPPKPGPFLPTPGYDVPCIGKLEDGTTLPDGLTLTSPVIAKGICAKIIWPSGNNPPWTPQVGDSIAVNLWIAGWDGEGTPKECTQTNSYPRDLTPEDVIRQFILIPLPDQWFSDWGNKGQTGTGEHSKVQMQYTVTTLVNVMSEDAVAISKKVTSYSTPYTVPLNTIDPGSGH
jgi:hypothetical protein